jgi:squalene-hopene/tetraprenyl-beta-curcumene cyclase
MDQFSGPLRQAIGHSVEYFLRTQDSSGFWVGELESNATITAEYLFFRRILNRVDPQREFAVARQLLATQRDGGWSLYYGGPPDLNTTIEALVALELAGLPLADPAMRQAAETVRDCGGLERARVFTRIWLALLGALPHDVVPAMPPELMLLPSMFPLNIYRFASWARGTIVPLLIVLWRPPLYAGPVPSIDHLYTELPPRTPARSLRFDRRSFFLGLDGVLKRSHRLLERNPWRRRAVESARQWILDHQETDGGWGGIIPAMINSTMALSILDGNCEAVEKGIAAVDGFGIVEDELFRLQSCVSPGWDTPWTILALAEAGLPPDHEALTRGARWLAAQQSKLYSDWTVAAPRVPAGGWPFEFANANYPDTDDTALVLQALPRTAIRLDGTRTCGLAWLLGMQNSDGGWAAFDRENTTDLVEQIPFCDFGEVLDPSSADVTAHVLELLGGLGYDREEPHVRRGLDYLWREQEADGAWYGRWGVNYIYGTSAVLMALKSLGFDATDSRVAKAVAWLHDRQNPDGGWGESCRSYTESSWRGRGPSTASQTAWAILGLLAVADAEDPALGGGVRWLLDHQNPDGTWEEPYFTGTGFPGDFYIKYHEYRNYFPLLALARVSRAQERTSAQSE